MAEKLTTQQRLAVENRGGKLLVSAAAGSGKTKVLVDRLLSYIMDADYPANLDDFLIITFTKAAATELRGKIAAKLSEKIALMPHNLHLQQQMQRLYLAKISTVHSFCSDILREYAYRLDISADFRIAEESECREMQLQVLEKVLDHAYQDLCDDPDFRAFVDTQGLGRDDYLIPQILLSVYNSARCHLDPDRWLDWCCDSFQTDQLTDASQTIWGKYLIDDLKNYLSSQICAFETCIVKASACDGFQKPVTLLCDTVVQLRQLHDCDTWDSIVANSHIDYGRLTFPQNCTDPDLADKIKQVRNLCKKGLEAKLHDFTDLSERLLDDLQESAAATRGLIALVRAFTREYDRLKRSRRTMDYGDLEQKMLDLLLGKNRDHVTSVAQEIGERFREVMVDEYQDTNEVQDAIFGALTGKRNNCFMVGDVKQSIYQFRLADPDIFIEKYSTFAPAETAELNEGRRVLLSSNFRSSGQVISAVNHVFSHCMSPEVGGLHYGEEEMLREGIGHVSIGEPEVELHTIDVQEDTYEEEAAFVADRISQLLDGHHMIRTGDQLRPITPDDIVILLRSPGSVGAHFVYALEQRGIRCTTGKGIDLLATDEISTLRSILQIISNPLQDIPLVAVLMSPVFGFTAEEMAAMRSANPFAGIYGLLQENTSEKAKGFLCTLMQLRQDVRMCTLSQLIQRIFLLTGIDRIYGAMADGEIRSQNLHGFYQIAADFEAASKRDLNQFLAYLDTVEQEGLRHTIENGTSGAVTVMSIHTSKGLEFPVVFLSALSRKFNLESARDRILCHKDLGLGMSCANSKLRVRYPSLARRAISRRIIADSISEEMRVLYVAMTRARDRLIMTYAVNKLQCDLQSMVTRLDMYDSRLQNAYVTCAGDWVLQSAMRRTEAGELFALGGYPEHTAVQDAPWNIHVHEGNVNTYAVAVEQAAQDRGVPGAVIDSIESSHRFCYPYQQAVGAPSKLTATQLKGREVDAEASQLAPENRPYFRNFRKASFAGDEITGQTYGNAVHKAMQHIRFAACTSYEAVAQEIKRLQEENLITQEQASLIDPQMIATLFATELGERMRYADNLLREFKFSVLVDAGNYVPGLQNEQVLLQGVVDCAIIEPDGITVLDFKTDRVTETTLPEVLDGYSAQVTAYANALEKIYQLPVKSAWLYFFRLDRFVQVK